MPDEEDESLPQVQHAARLTRGPCHDDLAPEREDIREAHLELLVRVHAQKAASDNECTSRNGFGAPVRTQPSAPIGAIHCRLFLRELRARGIDPERQLALLGIALSEHDELARSISAAQFGALLRLVEELSGDPDIGLHAGQQIRAEDMDLIDLLIRSSPDARSLCEHCAQYAGTIQQALDLEIWLQRCTVLLSRLPALDRLLAARVSRGASPRRYRRAGRHLRLDLPARIASGPACAAHSARLRTLISGARPAPDTGGEVLLQ